MATDETPKITTLIVDDSPVYRRILRTACGELENVKVVGYASNGASAWAQIKHFEPDVVLLDINMPELNGLEVLRLLQLSDKKVCVIAVTSKTAAADEQRAAAIVLGAFDFIYKPNLGTESRNQTHLIQMLKSRFDVVTRQQCLNQGGDSATCSIHSADLISRKRGQEEVPVEVVALGSSTGGPAALMKVLPSLPVSFDLPVLIAQHMPANFTAKLAQRLNELSVKPINEAQDGDLVRPGYVYVAPGGKQMKVEPGEPFPRIRITEENQGNHCSPSIDYLFQSVANVYGASALGIVMTGMGNDGVKGSESIERAGGTIITQDETSSVVYGMPKRVHESGFATACMTLDQITTRIIESAMREFQC